MPSDPLDFVDCLKDFDLSDWLHAIKWIAIDSPDIPPELMSLSKDITAQAFALHKATQPNARQPRGKQYLAGLYTTASIVAHVLSFSHLPDDFAIQIDTDSEYRAQLNATVSYSVSTADKRLYAMRDLGFLTITSKRSCGFFTVDDVRPTEALRKLAVKHGVSLGPINKAIDTARENQMGIVKVKDIPDQHGTRVSLPKADRLHGYKDAVRDLKQFNKLLASVDVEWTTADYRASPVQCNRSFLDKRFDRGGRLSGAFYLSLPSKDRVKHLRLNGERVEHADLKASHPSIAYAIAGQRLSHDPYDLGIQSDNPKKLRDALKIVACMGFWSEITPSSRLPKDARKDIPRKHTASDVFDRFRAANPALERLWGVADPLGPMLQFIESRLLMKAVTRCIKDHSISVLPLHDCIICPASKREVVAGVLSECFENATRQTPTLTFNDGSIYSDQG